ncbi:MAG: uncharacterized membrane protein (UPF0127 family) [Myxococcota bacterium]|jgi:uncharacterized membrane protein (UPF0127 family)
MLLAILLSCARNSAPEPVLPTTSLSVGGQPATVEIADTPDLRRQGLMERAALKSDHGMLFVYPDERPRSFWMKNTPLPLSIAFLDTQGRIVRIADMAPLDETSTPSRYPAMYALEMEQGWFTRRGVSTGDRVEGLPSPSQE